MSAVSVLLDIARPNRHTPDVLFMETEMFTDPAAVAERFRTQGRLLPDGVTYHASWMQVDGRRCFQLMEAPDRAALDVWVTRWRDLVDFDVEPVLTSHEFWGQRH